MKSEEGNKATFSHWPRLDTLFATQALISLQRLPEATTEQQKGSTSEDFWNFIMVCIMSDMVAHCAQNVNNGSPVTMNVRGAPI